MNELQPLLDLLGGNGNWLVTAVAWIGALRLVAKPVSGVVQSFFSKLVAKVTETPEPEDDELVAKLLKCWPYRALSFLVDWAASVKLPTTESLQRTNTTKGTNLPLWLLCGVLALGAGGCLTGCNTPGGQLGFVQVAPGADSAVVYAEWTAENASKVLDEFLAWERANEAALTNNPAIHATADSIRESAPEQLRELRRLTRQYKADRSDATKGQLQAATHALIAIANAVRAQMGKPPIVLPTTDPKLFNTGGPLP